LNADEQHPVNGMKMWKENENDTTILFVLKGLDILHKQRRVQVNIIVIREHSLPQVLTCYQQHDTH
jgi:hypothetical protein